jgi:2-polyprenyl-3-methyl-5-hydroxy-6-metoxy-1,4-benzoquinol methylase
MDERTIRYYDDNAGEIYARYQGAESPIARYLKPAFPPGAELLDIGAGSGRDLQIMIREGYDAYGAEPSNGLRALAIANEPGLAGRLTSGSLPGLASQLARKFDGIVCSAVFMHIPEEQQPDAACDMRSLLRPHGRLLLSIPRTRTDVRADGRDRHGRLFAGADAESVRLLFERLGFECLGSWEDADVFARAGFTWTTFVFEAYGVGP